MRELGCPDTSNLFVRYLHQGRAGAERPRLSPRKAARLQPTRPKGRTDAQHETAGRLSSACLDGMCKSNGGSDDHGRDVK